MSSLLKIINFHYRIRILKKIENPLICLRNGEKGLHEVNRDTVNISILQRHSDHQRTSQWVDWGIAPELEFEREVSFIDTHVPVPKIWRNSICHRDEVSRLCPLWKQNKTFKKTKTKKNTLICCWNKMGPIWLTFGDLFSVHIAENTLDSSQSNWQFCPSPNKTKAAILCGTTRDLMIPRLRLSVLRCTVNAAL